MKIFLAAVAFILPLSACAAQGEGPWVAQYRGVTSLEGFYVRQVELMNPSLVDAPQAVRDCVGRSLVQIAGESRNKAAQRFVDNPTEDNLGAYEWADMNAPPEKQAEARAAIERCAALAN